MRPSVRFEVFKRDGFTCAYCNRKPPDVVLEVDHIIPRVEGGDDDPENLITACWECNRGKGARLLDDRAPVADLKARTDLIRERERQVGAYHEAKREQRERQDAQFERVWNYWFDAWGADTLPKYHTPWESSLKNYIEKLGPDEVIEAIDIARGRFNYITTNVVKYFIGILRRKVAREEGRIVQCTICGKDIVLDSTQDAKSDWAHDACVEADG